MPYCYQEIELMKTSMKAFGTSSRTGHDSSEFYKRKIYNDHDSVVKGLVDDEFEPIDCKATGQIYQHSSESMHELPDQSVHLMVTSPPYNVGKEYDKDLSIDEYMNLLNRVFRETYRVLVPGGRACINIANIGRKPYLPLNAMLIQTMLEIGYLMRGEIIWNKSASAGVSCAWGSWCSPSNPVLRDVHEYIIVFSKIGYSRKSKERKGTIDRDDFLEWTKSIWQMPAESAKRVNHPAPFPLELPRRLIHLYTFENDIVLDPFIGSGTTAIACIESGRQYVGYDISEDYVTTANNRISNYLSNL